MEFEFSLLNDSEIKQFHDELKYISFGPSYCYWDKVIDLCRKFKLYMLFYPDKRIYITDDYFNFL